MNRHFLTSLALCIVAFALSSSLGHGAEPEKPKHLTIAFYADLSEATTALEIENDKGKMEKFDVVKDAAKIEDILKADKHYIDTFMLKAGKIEKVVFKRKNEKPAKP